MRFPSSRRRRTLAALGAALFSVLVLAGMQWFTFASVQPRLRELPNVPAARLEAVGYDVFRLAHSDPALVAADLGGDRVSARDWVGTARLATLRGIGTTQLGLLKQLDIHSIEQLADMPPSGLVQDLERLTGQDWVDARVRVWVRGAQESVNSD
jgi:hypothetical protein